MDNPIKKPITKKRATLCDDTPPEPTNLATSLAEVVAEMEANPLYIMGTDFAAPGSASKSASALFTMLKDREGVRFHRLMWTYDPSSLTIPAATPTTEEENIRHECVAMLQDALHGGDYQLLDLFNRHYHEFHYSLMGEIRGLREQRIKEVALRQYASQTERYEARGAAYVADKVPTMIQSYQGTLEERIKKASDDAWNVFRTLNTAPEDPFPLKSPTPDDFHAEQQAEQAALVDACCKVVERVFNRGATGLTQSVVVRGKAYTVSAEPTGDSAPAEDMAAAGLVPASRDAKMQSLAFDLSVAYKEGTGTEEFTLPSDKEGEEIVVMVMRRQKRSVPAVKP